MSGCDACGRCGGASGVRGAALLGGRLGAMLVVVGGGLLAGGCSSGSRQTGVRVGNETLEQMEAGVTTEAWLVAILGEPTSWAGVEGLPTTKVFRYALGEESGGLTSLFTGKSSTNTAVVYFLITDGIVTRFWADREIHQPLIGRPSPTPNGEKQ